MKWILPPNRPPYKHQSKCSGTALTELVLSLPFLLIMFVGTFEIGRHMNQISSLVQTSFNAAYYGAGLAGAPNQNIQDMEDRADQDLYKNFHNKDFIPVSAPGGSFVAGYPSTDEVRVSFNGTLRDLLGAISPFQIPLGHSADFTMPVLVRQVSMTGLNQFGNFSGGLYDQHGNYHAGCTSCSCLPDPC